jgi:hypothetical protein
MGSRFTDTFGIHMLTVDNDSLQSPKHERSYTIFFIEKLTIYSWGSFFENGEQLPEVTEPLGEHWNG